MEDHHLSVCFTVHSPSKGFFCYSYLPFCFRRNEPKIASIAYLLSSGEKPGKGSAKLFDNG